jgi:predicted transcriptional regulator
MENREDLLKIIDEKFDARIELSEEFKTRLMTIPSISRTYRKNNWLLVAGVAVLVSLNVLAISKKTKTNKQNYIIEQYSTNTLNSDSYE